MTNPWMRAVTISLLLASSFLPGSAIGAMGTPPKSTEIKFRDDDPAAQAIANRVLAGNSSEEAKDPTDRTFTAWAKISRSGAPTLFAMSGCSPVGNCGLYAFERSRGRWRLVLDSVAQQCSILWSSHQGRRDLSASMHGSATGSAIKTYWWKGTRYVRVSVRDVTVAR